MKCPHCGTDDVDMIDRGPLNQGRYWCFKCRVVFIGKPHKYRAKKTVVNGITFPSKKEAKYFHDLTVLQHAGEVSWFIRQPSFDLPGGIKYRADFLVVYDNGAIEVVDTKGFRTETFKNKMKLMKASYPSVPLVLIGKKGREKP